MKVKRIASTTHVDAHNQRMTRGALEDFSRLVNVGKKPTVGIEHDRTIPPIGKLLSATVEPRDDGEYQLVTELEYFEEPEWFTVHNGMKFFRNESLYSNVPFSDPYDEFETSDYEVSIDPINFESTASREAFINALKAHQATFIHHEFIRKAAVPDPEIIIKLAESVIPWLLTGYAVKKIGEKVLENISEKVAEDAAKFYEFLKLTIIEYTKRVRPQNRPITYVFVLPIKPSIEFVARTNKPDLVLASIVSEKLQPKIAEAEELEKTIGATRIQYLLDNSGEWEFNYLLTTTGGVIGTEKAFDNRTKKLEMRSASIEPAEGEKLE